MAISSVPRRTVTILVLLVACGGVEGITQLSHNSARFLCRVGSHDSLKRGTAYDPRCNSYVIELAQRTRATLKWGPETRVEGVVPRFREITRFHSNFVPIAYQEAEVNEPDIALKVWEVADENGYVAIRVRYTKLRVGECFNIYRPFPGPYADGLDSVGSECHQAARSILRRSWVFVIGPSGELLTNYNTVSNRARRGSVALPPSSPLPKRVLGEEIYFGRALLVHNGCNTYAGRQCFNSRLLYLEGSVDAFARDPLQGMDFDLYRRSRHPADIRFAKANIVKVKRPYDPVEVIFRTYRGKGNFVQLVLTVDRNGFFGLIYHVIALRSPRAKVVFRVGPLRPSFCHRVARVEAALGRDATKDSNIGRKGWFALTMSPGGILTMRRTRNSNWYGVCSGPQKPFNPRSSSELDGAVRGTTLYTFSRMFGTRLISISGCGSGADYVGFMKGAGDIFPSAYCLLTTPKSMQSAVRDVRRAGAGTFEAESGIMLRFIHNTGRVSIQGQVIYLFGRDKRIAGVINLPPTLDIPLAVAHGNRASFVEDFRRPGDGQFVRFRSRRTNVGRPGRNVFVMKASTDHDVFEIAPSNAA
eukprot:CAMPEP_0198726188 /NCGR_PEP_ID=MMETSP1475-20131203/3328_1 /TAXON_ID= ORGANISM="Unidentified sp., Strain CCMP1999" /NCGR_SAMPLE_ID=MMETSP1475 /ASSEMBLY_ACC=CAM_ASM_001111 /LENGTH=586 /DNA_ID=CAMNT_0044488091 /DNA_START=1 /DNA_END=1761 /DNA_ORIENTATION=+